MTQREQVYRLLRERGERGLTPLEALDMVGSLRLAAVIFDVKRDWCQPDEEVVNLGYTTPSGKHVARYVLRKVEPDQAQVMLPW